MNDLYDVLCEVCDRPSDVRVHDGCRRRIGEQLAALPNAYRALAAFLIPGAGRGGPRVSGTKDCPTPANLDALDLRSVGGIEKLTEWENDIRDLLDWGPAPFRGTVQQTVEGTVKFLTGNLLWICDQHPAVRDFAREVRELHGAVWSIVSPVDPADLPRRLGYCPTPVEDGLCGAVIVLPPYSTTAVCAWCATAWPVSSWLEFSAGQAEFMSTLTERT